MLCLKSTINRKNIFQTLRFNISTAKKLGIEPEFLKGLIHFCTISWWWERIVYFIKLTPGSQYLLLCQWQGDGAISTTIWQDMKYVSTKKQGQKIKRSYPSGRPNNTKLHRYHHDTVQNISRPGQFIMTVLQARQWGRIASFI